MSEAGPGRDWGMGLASAALAPVQRLRRGILHSLSTLELLLGGFGLVAALVTAALLSPVLGALPGAAGDFAPIGVAILLAPIGIGVALSRRLEVERFVNTVRGRATDVAATVTAVAPAAPQEALLDTSAIIDGRIAEVAASGFILADLAVPRFVLEELRRVADSSDPQKRRRGRSGLELLSRLQSEERARTVIVEEEETESSGSSGGDVDTRLVRLAKSRGAALVTTDANLARVAELEGVRALNLHVLANAVKTAVLPGERLTLELIEAGRGAGQAVGYLGDGTMVVVEEGSEAIGETRTLSVKRVIQTQAGRMVFAQLSESEAAESEAEDARAAV